MPSLYFQKFDHLKFTTCWLVFLVISLLWRVARSCACRKKQLKAWRPWWFAVSTCHVGIIPISFGHRLIWRLQSEPCCDATLPVYTDCRLSIHIGGWKDYVSNTSAATKGSRRPSCTVQVLCLWYGYNHHETATRGATTNIRRSRVHLP